MNKVTMNTKTNLSEHFTLGEVDIRSASARVPVPVSAYLSYLHMIPRFVPSRNWTMAWISGPSGT